jgi:UDP-3-O-[3-hydroxymyristoyl] glucosamine N-acyltransferase
LVQIGHNVNVGEKCLLVAQSGVAGSTELGDRVVLAGQAGIGGHIKIGSGALVAAQSGITSNVPENCAVRGTPAMPLYLAGRVYAAQRHIPALMRRVEKLEELAGNGPVTDFPAGSDEP